MSEHICSSFTDWNQGLSHHGIKGQKWGVRRYQNPDGSYTSEGRKHYGIGEGQSLSTKTYLEQRRHIAENYPEGFTKKEKAIINRIKNGEIIDRSIVNKIAYDHHEAQRNLGEKYRKSTNDAEKKELNDLMNKEQLLMDYAYDKIPALNSENKYQKDIEKETDMSWVDPTYRQFSSISEKADAEAKYLSMINSENYTGNQEHDDRFARECGHLAMRVSNLSIDGYDGKPQSERTRALYDYDPDGGDRPWARFIPKYKKSKEWTDIQKEREALKNSTGLSKAEKAMSGVTYSEIGKVKFDILWDAWRKASQRYQKAVSKTTIEQRERSIEKAFDQKIIKAVLQDLGYEVNSRNMELISDWIWYD